jgi:hypothetical protein
MNKSYMKRKANLAGDPEKSHKYDQCQTPGYALPPLLAHLPPGLRIWDPSTGEGNLARTLEYLGYKVSASDLLTGTNFFEADPPAGSDGRIENPPFSIKYKWLERSYLLGDPFALLLPVETIGAASAQRLFARYGVEIILLDQRINFKMPSHKSWSELIKPTPRYNEDGSPMLNAKGEHKKTTGAQFPTAWFTHGFNIGRELTFEHVSRFLFPWEEDPAQEMESR